MRSLALGLIALITCAAVLVAGAAAAPGSAKLVLVKKEPLVLRGLGFKGTQRVTVTVVVDGHKTIRRITTRAAGTFTVTFAQLAVDPCAFEARAVSRTASVAYKAPQRLCPIGLDPPRP